MSEEENPVLVIRDEFRSFRVSFDRHRELLDEKVSELLVQAQKTNGRISSLEAKETARENREAVALAVTLAVEKERERQAAKTAAAEGDRERPKPRAGSSGWSPSPQMITVAGFIGLVVASIIAALRGGIP